jgi:hypothetical protein
MDALAENIPAPGHDLDAIGRYRRDGYLMVPGVLDPRHVEQCLAALGALAADPGLEQGGATARAPSSRWNRRRTTRMPPRWIAPT